MAEFVPHPVLFQGGVSSDYEIVKASTGTLMTRYIPSGAQRLGVRAGVPANTTSSLGRLAGALTGLNAVTGAVSAIASVYGAYESRRTRRETESLRVEVTDLHQDLHAGFAALNAAVHSGERKLASLEDSVRAEGARTRWEVIRSREIDLEARWRNLSSDWDAFLNARNARVELAHELRKTARDFISRLTANSESGDEMRHAATAPYLFAGHLALAQALDAMGEPEQAARQIRHLEAVLKEIGARSITGLRLFDAEENREAVLLLWGLHEHARQLVTGLRDGSASISAPVIELTDLPIWGDLDGLTAPEGLALDAPIPVESIEEMVAVGRLGAGLASPDGPRAPTVRAALRSLGLEDATTVDQPIDREVLMTVLADEQGGLGAIRADFGITDTVQYPEATETVPIQLDWAEVVEREVSESWAQFDDERTSDAIARLERLIFFLTELVKVSAPQVYEEQIFYARGELLAILWKDFLDGATGHGELFTLHVAAFGEDVDWAKPCPHPECQIPILHLKERAIHGDGDSVARLLQELAQGSTWQIGPAEVAEQLHDLAQWGQAALVHEVLTRIIDEAPEEVPELDLWDARLLDAQVLALAGDRKRARGKVNRLIAAAEASGESPEARAWLLRAREVAESMRFRPSV